MLFETEVSLIDDFSRSNFFRTRQSFLRYFTFPLLSESRPTYDVWKVLKFATRDGSNANSAFVMDPTT